MYTRENNYDILRFFCMLCVIILHVSAGFCIGHEMHRDLFSSHDAIFFNVISRSAVPCFVMLSGAFILSKNIDLQIFYRKSFFKLFLPTLIFSVLYVFYDALTQIIGLYFGFHVGGGEDNKTLYSIIKGILHNILQGTPYYHLWFMYMLFGLYIVFPALKYIKNSLSTKQYILFSCLCCAGMFGQHFFGGEVFWCFKFVEFLGFVFLGDIIKEGFSRLNKKGMSLNKFTYLFLFIFFLVYYFVYLANVICENNPNALNNIMDQLARKHGCDPLIFIATVSLFIATACFTKKIQNKYVVNFLNENNILIFYIYLIHAGVLHFCVTFLRKILKIEITGTSFNIIFLTVIVFCISLVIAKISYLLYKKIVLDKVCV